MTGTTPIVSLAEEIHRCANKISEYATTNGLPQPSFELDGPEEYPQGLPEDIQIARSRLHEASVQMAALAAGPKESLMSMTWFHNDFAALTFIYHFKIAQAVPLVGDISFSELATMTKTNARLLKRILRYAMHSYMFSEPRPGHVAHTPLSKQLATSERGNTIVGIAVDEFAPAAMGLIPAISRWGDDAQEPEQTAYSLVHTGGKLSHWDYMALPENRDKEVRFAGLMRATQSSDGWHLNHAIDGFDWAGLGSGATVVDVGGNTGATAYALAESFPNLSLVVEDLPTVIATGRASLPPSFADRVSFQEYNFMEQIQPVTDADVYFMRMILHDWSDKYAAKLLRNTASIMKPGQILLIMDSVVPAPGTVSRRIEKHIRNVDLTMMLMYNSLEREESDWKTVLNMADPRLAIRKISTPPRSVLSLIEVVMTYDATASE